MSAHFWRPHAPVLAVPTGTAQRIDRQLTSKLRAKEHRWRWTSSLRRPTSFSRVPRSAIAHLHPSERAADGEQRLKSMITQLVSCCRMQWSAGSPNKTGAMPAAAADSNQVRGKEPLFKHQCPRRPSRLDPKFSRSCGVSLQSQPGPPAGAGDQHVAGSTHGQESSSRHLQYVCGSPIHARFA